MKFFLLFLSMTLTLKALNAETFKTLHSEKTPFIYGVKTFQNGSNKSFPISPSDYNLSLIKGLALNHTFLLKTSIINSVPVPTGRSLASKVVSFEKRGNKVYLFESTEGKLSSLSLPTKILLAEFPILWETDKIITIDFKKGMKELYLLSSSFASDIQRTKPEKIFKITKSYINKVETRGKSLFIDHLVRIDIPGPQSQNSNIMAQLKYVLSSYEKNKTFKSKPTSFMNQVGYFELPPITDPKDPTPSNQVKINILKFDSKNPIVYSLSSNIPEDFKQAVIDGILYWNQAFEKEFIKIKELPQNVFPHEPGYNIIQWLDWDTAGFAYADLSPDPLTGEIKQSHVYLTSVFGNQAKLSARQYLLQLVANQKKETSESPLLELKGFKSAHSCKKDFKKSLEYFANTLINSSDGLSDPKLNEIFKRYAQDYVREVVAHEVGHTLGLRHNFAGSLITNLNQSNWDIISKSYLLTGTLQEGVIPSSSVMDYLEGMTASMLGAHIRLKKGALPYDKMAIEWGYHDKPLTPGIPFCTDGLSIRKTFIDCRPWDKFRSPIENQVHTWDHIIKTFPLSLALKFSFLGDKKELDKLKKIQTTILHPRKNAAILMKFMTPLLRLADKKSEFLQINMYNPRFNSLDLDEYKKATSNYKKSEFQKFGGIGKVLLENFTPGKETLSPAFLNFKETLLLNLANLFGTSNLPAEEQMALTDLLNSYFEILEKEFLNLLSESLQSVQLSFRELSMAKSLENFSEIILYKKGDQLLTKLEDSTLIFRPFYQYFSKGKSLRSNVIALLKTNFFPKHPSFNRKMKKVKDNILEKHANEFNLILNGKTLEDVEDDDLYDYLFLEKDNFKPLRKNKKDHLL